MLKHTEDLALANRLVEMRDDYSVFATRAFRDFSRSMSCTSVRRAIWV
ncbi:MAG: hypothetical protein ACLRSD_03605 [Oscillibacter sp.]